jgi:hypothetical protein
MSSKQSGLRGAGEVIGQNGKVTGTYVDTLANGEDLSYEATSVLKDGQLSMETGGRSGRTARLKGTRARAPAGRASDGGLTFDCTGAYTLP